MTQKLLPCPFCGRDSYFERMGTRNQSCIIACHWCGCRLETGEVGHACGNMWNRRVAQPSVPDGWKLVPVEPVWEDGDPVPTGWHIAHIWGADPFLVDEAEYQRLLSYAKVETAAPKFGEEE